MQDPYSLMSPVIDTVSFVLDCLAALVAVFAAIDAASRRPDAFAAADKQTKGLWTGVTVACAGVCVLGAVFPGSFFSAVSLLWLAAWIGMLVYLLDVRPRLREVQRGSRW